jgi:outer membrane autotransporter protein
VANEAFAAVDTSGARAFSYSRMPTKAPVYKAPPSAFDPDVTFWAQDFGAWAHFDSDGNAAKMDRSAGGIIAGVDRRLGDIWRVGFAGGYMRSDITVSDRANSADVDTFHLAAYAGAQVGAWSLRTGASFAWHHIDTSRSIVFPGFFDSARASYDATSAQVFGEVGYGMAYGNVAVEPFAGLAWVHLDTGSFAETAGIGSVIPLLGSGNNEDVEYSSLGIRFATSMMLGNGWAIPRVSVAWQHAFGDVTPTAALAFQSTLAAFDVQGVPIASDAALVDAGLDFKVSPAIALGVAYAGQLSGDVQDHAVKGNFIWKF